MNNDILIRKAELEDMEAVHGLVMELAIFEKEPDAVIVDVSYYKKAFTDKKFSVSVAELDQQVIGMVLYYEAFSTWKGRMLYLEDFVIKKVYRYLGVGQMLFDEFISEAKDSNCNLVKWQVLDWNAPAINFYKKNNATIEKEWWNGKINFVES